MKKFILLVVMLILLICQDFSQKRNVVESLQTAAKYVKAVGNEQILMRQSLNFVNRNYSTKVE